MTLLSSTAISKEDKMALWLSAAFFVFYCIYSFFSNGFYQHDEIGHYFNMREFWNNPNVILGNSAKTGYKLMYVIPSLLGNKFLVFFNSALAALSCFLTFKVAHKLGSRFAWLAFFMLALQPYWIQLSFRNYADTFSGFVLIFTLFLHFNKKYLPAALLLSFAGIIRQEFLLLLPFYGIWHALNKRWLCFLVLGLFPILNNIWGFMATGEPLYLLTSSAKTAAKYADEWPRQGFDHYFLMSIVIWGATQCSLLILFFISSIFKKAKSFNTAGYEKEYRYQAEHKGQFIFISLPLVMYFFIHCIFNWESVKIGAATGGNLRYMTAVSPLVALLSAIACDRYRFFTRKNIAWIPWGGWLIFVALFLTYTHNNVNLKTEPDSQTGELAKRDYIPLLFSLISIGILAGVKNFRKITLYLSVAALLFVLAAVRPFKFTPEDKTMEVITNSLIAKKYTKNNTPIYVNHTLFKYFYDKSQRGIYNLQFYMDSLSLQTAPVGSIMVWESHYGYRPRLNKNTVNLDYFTRRPQQYILQQSRVSDDQRFQVAVFEKMAL